jgi:plastocyanin
MTRLARYAALACLALAATATTSAPAASTRRVTLKDIAFTPKRLSISKGSTVTFAFRDATTVHNVTSVGSKRFARISSRASGSASRTFRSAGTYRYECTLHPGMTGRIVVR